MTRAAQEAGNTEMFQYIGGDIAIDSLRPAGLRRPPKSSGSRPLRGQVLVALVFVLPVAWTLSGTRSRTAAECIAQAHRHDNMYTLGPEASREKAVRLYELALQADPNEPERLHILSRMAQLYGSAYQVERGEKPDFRKAIGLCQQIIDTYPPEEPMVVRATLEIGDHYVSLWEFQRAVEAFKKTLDCDIRPLETLAAAREKQGQSQEAQALRRTVEEIQRYQGIAVTQVAYAAGLIDPLWAQGELQGLADRYGETFIGAKARKLLQENRSKLAGLWAPDVEQEGAATQLRDGQNPFVAPTDSPKGLKPRPEKAEGETSGQHLLPPNTSGEPQRTTHTAQARAPPRPHLALCLAVAAGLVGLGLAVLAVQTKKLRRKG